MTEIERFTAERQRNALRALVASAAFLHTSEGAAFVQQIECFLVPHAFATAKSAGVGASWILRDDVVNTALVRLTAGQGRVAKYAAEARDEPWAYVAVCLSGWIREQIGVRGSPLDEQLLRAVPRGDDEHLTPIDQVVALTFNVLQPYAAPAQQHAIQRLLVWLAQSPPQRISYETADRAAAQVRFPELDFAQISAVMNIAWGGRPRRRETSLFAAFLTDPSFRVSNSPTHARALARFRRAMGAPSRTQFLREQLVA